MAGAKVVRPASLKLRLDRFEILSVVIRIFAREMSELVSRTNIFITAIRETVGARFICLAIVVVVVIVELRHSFGDGASSPPAANRARNSADDRADRARWRSYCGARESTRYAAYGVTDFVSRARVVPVAKNSAIVTCVIMGAVHRPSWNQFSGGVTSVREGAILGPCANRPLAEKKPRIHIGTQGWNYDAWVGPFFPINTRPVDFLAVYSRAFDSVEVDSTFYGIPAPATFQSWYDRTPHDFVFTLKLPQEITHEQRLRDSIGVSEQFYERARELRHKLGPILVQLGPDFEPNELPALVDFVGRIPSDLRFSIEFRHRGWLTEGVIALLRDRNVGITIVDGRWVPRKIMLALARRPTADFAYIRWMGPNRNLVDFSRVQVDRMREIDLWVEAISEMPSSITDVYGFVANHFSGHSPATAREFQYQLGQRPVDPATLGEQLSLF